MGKLTWVTVLTSAALIGGLIGAGSVVVSSAEENDAKRQAAQTVVQASAVPVTAAVQYAQSVQPTAAVSQAAVIQQAASPVSATASTTVPTAQPSATAAPAASSAKSNASAISKEEAGRIAAAYVQGTVKEIEREKEGGKLYYEVEVRVKGGEAEVKVDALNGKVVHVDYDLDDDRDDDDDDDWYDDDDRNDDHGRN